MVAPQTRKQRRALLASAVILLVLGSTITITGFVFEFHGVYDEISDAKIANVQRVVFPRTQYWLGLPLFLLALYVSVTRFYSSSTLYIIGLVLCSFAMVASLCALGLQSVIWYISLDLVNIVNTGQCYDVHATVNDDHSSNPRCNCKRELHYSNASEMQEYELLLTHMTCSEVKRFPSIVSVLVILSILAFLTSQATCFVYIQILRLFEPNLYIPCLYSIRLCQQQINHYSGGSSVHSDEFHGTNQHVLLNEQQM